jgi:hypothetical protein
MSLYLHESVDKVVIEPTTCDAACYRQDELRQLTRHVFTQVAKCIAVDGGILKTVLYWVNCTNFVTLTINTGIRNSTYLFLINNFGTVQ